MQNEDKINQLKKTLQGKKEGEIKTHQVNSQEVSPGMIQTLKKKIGELEKALDKSKAEQEEYKTKAQEARDQYVRTYADNENFRKRVMKEKEDLLKYGSEKILKELLPVLDSLEQAIEHGVKAEDLKKMVEGVELVLKQMLKTLEKFGLMPLSAKGKPFDPNYHEAMGHHESEHHEPNTVVEEYRRGYKLHDRLLRPALVTVAKPPEKKD